MWKVWIIAQKATSVLKQRFFNKYYNLFNQYIYDKSSLIHLCLFCTLNKLQFCSNICLVHRLCRFWPGDWLVYNLRPVKNDGFDKYLNMDNIVWQRIIVCWAGAKVILVVTCQADSLGLVTYNMSHYTDCQPCHSVVSCLLPLHHTRQSSLWSEV